MNIPPMLIARYLFEYAKYWQRAGFEYEKIKKSDWHAFFTTVEKNPVLSEKGKDLFAAIYAGIKVNLKSILKS